MSTGVYAAHRENQRERILEVAENLFIQKGIESVTFSDIADEARLTRATVYRYYGSKEEIAQAIFKLITKGWRERNEREVWNYEGSGHARLERFLTSFFGYLFQNPREASFVAELNYLYAKNWTPDQFAAQMLEHLQADRDLVLASIRQGMADGSVRQDVEPELMLAAFFNFVPATISRLGEMGDKVEREFGVSAEAIFGQVCRFFLDGLKPQGA
jgi:AcrR family transcriptional regulator